jgi:hypothetical protein
MATWQRMIVLFATTIGVGIAGIIYYRVGVDNLFPMAMGGPFSPAVGTLETLVPLILALIEVGVAAWAIAGGVQQERARVRGPR